MWYLRTLKVDIGMGMMCGPSVENRNILLLAHTHNTWACAFSGTTWWSLDEWMQCGLKIRAGWFQTRVMIKFRSQLFWTYFHPSPHPPSQNSSFQAKSPYLLKGQGAIPGHVFGCITVGRAIISIRLIEAMDAARSPGMDKDSSLQQNAICSKCPQGWEAPV